MVIFVHWFAELMLCLLMSISLAPKWIGTSCDFKILVKYGTVNLVMIKICFKFEKTVLYFQFDVFCSWITFITWMMNKTKLTKNTKSHQITKHKFIIKNTDITKTKRVTENKWNMMQKKMFAQKHLTWTVLKKVQYFLAVHAVAGLSKWHMVVFIIISN